MSPSQFVTALLQELGPRCEEIDGIEQLGEEEWALLYGGERRIDLDLDAARDVLVVQTALGTPARGREAETFATLLSYNMLWAQTGGARMALGGAEGEAVLLLDVPLEGLGWGRLDAILRNVAGTADDWTRVVRGEGAGQAPQAGSGPAWPGQLA